MKQETRDRMIFYGFMFVKLVLFARTGVDTWTVSHDIINVILIDGVFMGMWLAAAYGGKSETALSLRPFAAVGAWLTYASMIAIGWEAHHDIVSIAARIAGAVALSFDTWDMIVIATQRIRIQRKADTFEMFQERIDKEAMRNAYAASIRKLKAGEMQTAINMIAQKRIEGYAQAGLAALPDIGGSRYHLLESGHVHCDDCGWISDNAYDTAKQAQPVWAAHTRSAAHRAQVAQVIRIDVTPDN